MTQMPSTRWLNKRRPYWTRLTELVERSGRGGVRSLTHKELQELGLLYRQAASDLAAVREDPLEQGLARSLNQLLARAHNLLYAGRRQPGWGVVEFYWRTFPRIFRETLPYT
ncbi:MAG: stage II sporulation protein M, partial [Bryobacteraceae bacterium]